MLSRKFRSLLGVELVEVSALEKLIACLTGGLAIWLLFWITHLVLPVTESTAVLASMGASSVLLFGVPHGPLSQPWPVIAGHGISAGIGVVCAQFIPNPALAAACAVGLAIGAMHQCKCIHPPGGATAFTAVMGGPAIHALGYKFILTPVLANAVVMVSLAVLLNFAFKWRRYPAALGKGQPAPAASPSHEAVVTALRSLDSFVDVSEEELLRLVELIKLPPKAT